MNEKEIFGYFLPQLLRLGINFDYKNIDMNALDTNDEVERTFFHEFVHLLHTIGTTYGQNVISDVIFYISQTMSEMGGDEGLVIPSISDIKSTSSIAEIFDHLKFHSISLDGGYGSRSILGDNENQGDKYFDLNEDSVCYEYVRWNTHDNCYFATPIGATAIQECYAYIVEKFYNDASTYLPVINLELNLPSNSYNHYYVAPLDALYYAISPNQLEKFDDLFATLLVILDMCLMIPSTKYRNHPDWAPMTSPSFRFTLILSIIKNFRLVSDFSADEYFRFTEEVSDALDWPSPTKVAMDFLERINDYFVEIKNLLSEYIETDPKTFHNWVEKEIRRFKQSAVLPFNTEMSKKSFRDKVDVKAQKYKESILSNPTIYLGMLGLGIMEYMIKALEIRTTRPDKLIYPTLHVEELFNVFPVPQITFNDISIQDSGPVSPAVFMDVQALSHLWPMVQQWKEGKRKNIICGNRLIDIPCLEQPYKDGMCPNWPLNKSTSIRCTFTEVINFYKLSGK